MPLVSTQDRPLIPAGEHTLTLMQVSEVEVDDSFHPGTRVTKWIWEFDSDDKDEDGVPFTHKVWTKTVYGHAKAGLTVLLSQLVPGITQESANKLDTDTLIGQRFKAMIRQAPDDSGKVRAQLAYIGPLASGKGKVKREEMPA